MEKVMSNEERKAVLERVIDGGDGAVQAIEITRKELDLIRRTADLNLLSDPDAELRYVLAVGAQAILSGEVVATIAACQRLIGRRTAKQQVRSSF